MEKLEEALREDLLPDPRTLERLAELVHLCGLVSASRLAPVTEADRHRLRYGHRLTFGCCRERCDGLIESGA